MRPDPVAAGHPAGATEGLLSIEVELVTGRGRDWWPPRPGRVFAASPEHTFAQFAEAVDVAFGRWDLDHLRMFVLPDGVEVSWSTWRDGPAFPDTRDGRYTRLDLLTPGTAFAYVFDLGADWTHLCTVRRDDIALAHPPTAPLLRHGWGTLPDQYGRDRAEDSPTAPAPRSSAGALTDLPPLLPSWGPLS